MTPLIMHISQGYGPKAAGTAGSGKLSAQMSLPAPGQRLQALIAARRTARGQGEDTVIYMPRQRARSETARIIPSCSIMSQV